MTDPESTSGVQRRKAQTRAALLEAAQDLIAEGRTAVPIQEITRAAGLGTGSFYNHFATKEELFAAALEDALDRHGDFLDAITADLEDPAAVFATSFRITGRLPRLAPRMSRVILNNAAQVMRLEGGLASRARRDLEAAARAGRFTYDDLDVAMLLVTGATLSLTQKVLDDGEVDDARLTDAVTAQLLRTLGLTTRQAERIAHQDLPEAWRLALPGEGAA